MISEANAPSFLKEINNLVVKDRKALKVNMPTDLMKIEVQISTICGSSFSLNETVFENKIRKFTWKEVLPYIITNDMLH